MAAISVIGRSELEGATRIDAEYYHPRYIALANALCRNSCKSLVQTKALLDCSAFYPSIVPHYSTHGIPFLRIDDIKNGFVRITKGSVFLAEKVLAENPSTITTCLPGDIVIAKGGNTVAKVGILTNAYPKYAACRDLIVVRTSALAAVNKLYLLGYLLSGYGHDLMIRTASQTGQPHLTIQSIQNLLIPVFDKNLQEAVARMLLNAEDLFSRSQAAISEAQSKLLSEVGLTNWNCSDTTYVSQYRSLLTEGRIDAEHFHPTYIKLRKTIEDYRGGSSTLAKLCVPSQATVEPRRNPDEIYTYIELRNVDEATGIIDESSRLFGREAPSRARMLLHAGDVIASSVSGSLEKVALVPPELSGAVGSTGFFVLKSNTEENEYLFALVRSPIVQEQMRCEASGTILMAVGSKALRKIRVPQVPADRRAEIAELVRTAHRAHTKAKASLTEAQQTVETAINRNSNVR